jgi:hypothetical protein
VSAKSKREGVRNGGPLRQRAGKEACFCTSRGDKSTALQGGRGVKANESKSGPLLRFRGERVCSTVDAGALSGASRYSVSAICKCKFCMQKKRRGFGYVGQANFGALRCRVRIALGVRIQTSSNATPNVVCTGFQVQSGRIFHLAPCCPSSILFLQLRGGPWHRHSQHPGLCSLPVCHSTVHISFRPSAESPQQ